MTPRTTSVSLMQRVSLVGSRYPHHAAHSGYEGFGRHMLGQLEPPVRQRWLQGRLWKLNRALAGLVRHPWYSPGALMIELGALRRMLRTRGHLYHLLYGDSDLWLLRKAHRLTGNKLVASFHQPSAYLSQLGPIERVARYLDAVVLLCDAQRAYFESFMPPGRVHVVRHGVDTHFFRPPEQPPTRKVCVTVGSHLRDFATLGQTIREIWRQEPDMEFVAVGTQNEKKWYFETIDDPRMTYLERISDEQLRSTLQSARVALLALHDVTANNAVMEAMACGVPVVATDIGGMREYVNQACGILCAPGDPVALARAALLVLEDDDLRARMSQESRRRAERQDFRLVGEEMCRLYSRILQESDGDRAQEPAHGVCTHEDA